MRRNLMGPSLGLAVLWTLPASAWASTSFNAGVGPAEDDVVVVDDEMEVKHRPPKTSRRR